MESSENPQRLLHDDDRVGDDQFADGKLVKHINNRSIVAPRDLYTDALTENELEQGRKLRKLRSTTLALSQGSFLPLLVDKLRNNIRSRFLLASVYGIATACVALVVVLLLNFNEPVTWTATFSVPPWGAAEHLFSANFGSPPKGHFGRQLPRHFISRRGYSSCGDF